METLGVFVVFGIVLTACSAIPAVEEVVTEIPITDILDDLESEETSDPQDLAPAARFTIEADSSLQPMISALYESYFSGELPEFVEDGAALLVEFQPEQTEFREEILATFLPDAVLVPLLDDPEVQLFIDFAISADGQEVLIGIGALPEAIQVTDQAGNLVTINQPVRRVISAYGPSTALVYSVGAGDRLVSASYLGARDPEGAAAMERIDPRFQEIMGDDNFNQSEFNIEQSAVLNTDLVLTSARADWLDAIDQLDIPVILFDPETPEALQEAVLLTGQLFGPHTTAQAEVWVSYYNRVVSEIESRTTQIPTDERPQVLFTGTNALRVASGEMYQTDIIQAAGGKSVSSELYGFWNDVNLEQIALWNPEIIIVPPYGGASVEAITESQEWQILDAVAAGKVYRMPKLVVPWDTPAPDSVLGIIWMAQLLNAELVDFDCSQEVAYFYPTFYNYAISPEEVARICVFE